MTDQRTINYWALAPFGRIGHRLGWRWIFYFTFPIPYHPWLARSLPLLLALWVAWLAFGGEEVAWTAPLWTALILAIPLSVPFLQWILFAFRLHLIQALMLPASLLLLGTAAARGDVPPSLLAVPILYFGGFAAVAVAGRIRINAWRAANRRVEEMAAKDGTLPPLLLRGPRATDIAGRLVDRLSLPSLHYEAQGTEKEVLRIADPEVIAWLETVRDMRLDLFQMSAPFRKEHHVVHLRAAAPGAPSVIEPAPAPSARFVRGTVGAVRAEAPGRQSLIYWHGRPEPMSFIGGFYFLIRLRLGSTASFSPEWGFLPSPPRTLGTRPDEEGAYLVLAEALRENGVPPAPFADAAAVRRRVQALLDQRLGPELSALDRLIASPTTWMERRLDTLLRLPQLYADRAEELVEALRVARDARHQAASILLAQLIAALPADDFQRVGDALLAVVNSKRLAGRVKVEEHGEPPRLEGLRLLIHVPQLYIRLPELGERARFVIEGLLKLLPKVEALQKAKAKLDEATTPPPPS